MRFKSRRRKRTTKPVTPKAPTFVIQNDKLVLKPIRRRVLDNKIILNYDVKTPRKLGLINQTQSLKSTIRKSLQNKRAEVITHPDCTRAKNVRRSNYFKAAKGGAKININKNKRRTHNC